MGISLVILVFSLCTHLCLSTEVQSASLDSDKQSKIEDLIETSIMSAGNHVPALGLVIARDNKVLYSNGFGYKNVDKREEADENTLFSIGSITKSFTAALVVKVLHEKFPHLGEDVLDTPIRTLISEYNFTLSDKIRSESVTFRDLLAHRVCLMPDFLGLLFDAYENNEDLIFRQRFGNEKCKFRSGFTYNNGLYTLAGDIVKTIANNSMSYTQLMESLFKEIGMSDTTFVNEADNLDDLPNRSRPYYWKGGKYQPINPELLKMVIPNNPAGGILSSAKDMGKYMQFHLNHGKVGDKQIIPEKVMKWLYKSSNSVPDTWTVFKKDQTDIIDFDFAYALGFTNGIYDGYKRVAHAGFLMPYESYMTLHPDLNLGIFTVTSGPGFIPATNGHRYVHAKIVDIIQGLNRPENSSLSYTKKTTTAVVTNSTENSTKNVSDDLSSNDASKVEIDYNSVVGHYGNTLSGDMDITLKINESSSASQLYMNYGRWGQGWLKPLNQTTNNTFSIIWDSDFKQFVDSLPQMKLQVAFNEIGKLKVYMKGEGIEEVATIFEKGLNSKDFIKKLMQTEPANNDENFCIDKLN